MDAATAWAEAMKFANRPNPYPYFEELRKTPVAKVSERTYVVTGYPELLALSHDLLRRRRIVPKRRILGATVEIV